MPERWLKGNDRQGYNPDGKFQYLPFGFGPRMCIGKRVAEMEIHIVLAKVRCYVNSHVILNCHKKNFITVD